MNAKTKLRAFHLAAVIGAVPLAFTAMLPSAQQAPKPGASSHQSDSGSSTRSTSRTVRAAASRSAFPIQHVVVVFLENHSFDSVLGFWCDDHPGRCPDGGMPSSVTLSNGTMVDPGTTPDTVPNVTHNVASQEAAIDGGRMDGWQNISNRTCDAATGYQCISGYQPSQVPNVARLAQSFAISDHTFSVADSPSWAGHMAIAAASQDHFYGDNPNGGSFKPPGWGCDSGFTTPWFSPDGKILNVPSCVPDPSLNPRLYPNGGAFRPTPVRYLPTIMDRLNAAGLSWKIYGAPKGTKGYGIWDICPTFAECLDTSQDKRLVPDANFLTDAAAGKLPAFSIVTPGGPDFLNAGHNGMSMKKSDDWVGQLVSAVMSSPDWSSTALFLTWDDFGGFYDQVRPPVEPDGTQEGVRVPMVIVSPYARPGYTDTVPTTFAGVLSYTEHDFGLPALGVNDAHAYDFAKAFNYHQPPLKPIRMVTSPLPASAKRIRVTPALEHDPT